MQKLAHHLVFVALVVASVALVAVAGAATPTQNNEFIGVRLALKQQNLSELEQALWSVSDPASPKYGSFLTPRAIGQLIGVPSRTLRDLRAFLHSIGARHGSVHVHATRDYIDAELPAEIAHEMIGDAGQRQRTKGASTGISGRFADHNIMRNHVSFAMHLEPSARLKSTYRNKFAEWDRLPTRAERMATAALKQLKEKNANDDGTPATQRSVYGVPEGLVGTNPNNRQLVYGTGTYGFTQSDLVQYYQTMNISASEINELTVTQYYGQQGGDNWGEGTLDVSLLSAIAPGIVTLVTNNDNSSSAEEGDGFGPAMLSFLTTLVNDAPTNGVPNVISLSLGSLSWDSCNLLCEGVESFNVSYSDCQAYMQQQRQVCMYPDSDGIDRMNTEFMKLGVLGSSIFAAAGDGGSHFSFQFFNSDAIGTVLNQVACKANFPTFPAESPYVVGVGGTDWTNGGSTPSSWAASGGGFSWRFPMPPYQQAAVKNYLATAQQPPASAFNSSNRGYPDLAALATNVPIVFSGSLSPAAGTSCSAPEAAALFSLLNDQRMNKGLKPLGFVNPLLYSLASNSSVYSQIFIDLTQGSTDCDGNGECCGQGTGFNAAVGFDVQTGLGQPIFSGLMQYLLNDDFLQMFQ